MTIPDLDSTHKDPPQAFKSGKAAARFSAGPGNSLGSCLSDKSKRRGCNQPTPDALKGERSPLDTGLMRATARHCPFANTKKKSTAVLRLPSIDRFGFPRTLEKPKLQTKPPVQTTKRYLTASPPSPTASPTSLQNPKKSAQGATPHLAWAETPCFQK